MIRPWVAVLTSIHITPIFGQIWLVVAAVAAYAALVVLADVYFFPNVRTIGPEFHGFLSLILGLLLVFRTNTSYDRWWAGRGLWGQLVNDSRNLAIKVQTCVQASEVEKKRLGRWLIDFSLALKGHLRGGIRLADLPSFANAPDVPHVPVYIAARIYDQIEAWRRNNQVGGFELLFLDSHAKALMDICGACEKIQKSPISLSYRWFIRQLIALYLFTLPWGLVENYHYLTIPAVAIMAYFMIGVEMIAEVIEDPFGISADDLRLSDLCRTIESSVVGIFADPTLAPDALPIPSRLVDRAPGTEPY